MDVPNVPSTPLCIWPVASAMVRLSKNDDGDNKTTIFAIYALNYHVRVRSEADKLGIATMKKRAASHGLPKTTKVL